MWLFDGCFTCSGCLLGVLPIYAGCDSVLWWCGGCLVQWMFGGRMSAELGNVVVWWLFVVSSEDSHETTKILGAVIVGHAYGGRARWCELWGGA